MASSTRFCQIFALILSFQTLAAKPIRYQISPVFKENTQRLHIRLELQGDADGETDIALPGEFGSAQNLHRAIRHFAVQTRGCQLKIDADTLFARIEHAPNQQLRLSYEVVQDFPGNAVTISNAFRPIVQREYFHLLGCTFLLYPKDWNAFDVTLSWEGFPKKWTIHNSFGSNELQQKFSSNSLHWLESVFVGGDFRISTFFVREKPVSLAIRGNAWAFPDSLLSRMLQATVETQRNFWNDFDIPFYTVTLLPLALENMPPDDAFGHSYQYLGTGLLNSFAAFATPSKKLTVSGLHHLFNHELMHDWVGNKIRNGGDLNDMTFGWFSEGFTEYFAYKNMMTAGFLSPEEYVGIINREFFQQHYTQPIAEAPNSEIQRHFFNNSDISQLPYKRGFIFAFFLDNAIKVESRGEKSLHDFMLDLLDYYYEADRDLLSDFNFFEKNLGKYLKTKDIERLYQTHIVEGKLIAAEQFVLPDFFEMKSDARGVPVLSLKKEGDAWLAGMSR